MAKQFVISVMLTASMTVGIANGQNTMKKDIIQTAGHTALGEFAPEFARLNGDVLFGEVWTSDIQTREEFQMSTPYPIGEPNTGYAQYFIGNSYLAPMEAEKGGPVNVTFEPRCRNNWHIHHRQVQVLVCVAGRGWYQEWGKEPVELKPGVVIAIPAEVKHWHGAAKDSWMQHLTYHTHVEDDASNEWLEPVTDEIYQKLK